MPRFVLDTFQLHLFKIPDERSFLVNTFLHSLFYLEQFELKHDLNHCLFPFESVSYWYVSGSYQSICWDSKLVTTLSLLIVKDFKNECFIDRAEWVDKIVFLGSLLSCKDKILFSASNDNDLCKHGSVTATDVVPVTHMQTKSSHICVMWHEEVKKGQSWCLITFIC